jgi:RimJ/RimL family protein N-acetyltransferase
MFVLPTLGGADLGMGLVLLDQADYGRAAAAMEPLSGLHGSVPAVLAGTAEGSVRVDDPALPRVVLLSGPEGLYLGGAPDAATDLAALREAIPHWAYLYPAPAWLAAIDSVLPTRFMLRQERLAFSIDLTPAALPHLRPLSGGLDVRPLGDGIGTGLYRSDVLVARCRLDLFVEDRIEVGIWTHPDHRRQGLAARALGETLRAAARNGIRKVGWHCLATNTGSAKVATANGFSGPQRYVAYGARLPAENARDLSAAQWESTAQHFAAGATEIPLLGLLAAEAWSVASRREPSLAAVERLVESDWNGQVQWLAESWALAPLRAEPRFLAALERQRSRG